MYKLKQEKIQLIKKYIKTQKKMSEITGLDLSYINQIYNGRAVSKVGAFAITKATCPSLEIVDLFDYIEN